ncbi:MAG: EamA family transporter, partial [Spirochaetales bacterium]|nr:EamA family transporter [Spirochaetales bacterium]
MRHRQLIGSLILLIVAVIWGTAFAFQRMGTGVIGPMTFTASRMTLSAVAVGFVSFLIKDP